MEKFLYEKKYGDGIPGGGFEETFLESHSTNATHARQGPKRHAVGNLNRSVPIDEITPILGKVKRKLRL